MVKKISISFSFFLAAVCMADTLEFRLQLSKPTFFEGEKVTATFLLEADKENVIEVEVIKFPEFRGFWSENLMLRQGPIHLTPTAQKGKFVAVIGSYAIQSILEYKSAEVRPMKLLIKGLTPEPFTLESVSVPNRILSLPPIPPALQKVPFSGGVGNFALSVDNPQVVFRKGEPFKIRITLSGEGNFSEINTLPIRPPADFTTVSQNSFQDAFLGRSRKFFDWVFSTESDTVRSWKIGSFLFFDPQSSRYHELELPEIQFSRLEEPSLPENLLRKQAIAFEPKSTWSNGSSHSILISTWKVTWALALAALSWIIFFQQKMFRITRAADPKRWWRAQKKKVEHALQKQDWSTFVPLAAQLVRKHLSERGSLPEKGHLLLEADHQLRFSPDKKLQLSPEMLLQIWSEVAQDLGASSQDPSK
ncbi:hypothetical protein EBR78_04895 [bacterium]|nr:hypothetical protein [bacterium]